jgi:hypothetical protein
MNPWWNLPFAVMAALALWCRVGAPQRVVEMVARLLGYFGVNGDAPRQRAADFFGITGMSGLLFVAWSDELAALPDAWLLVDALLTALGLGLLGAWLLSHLGREEAGDDGPERTSRQESRTMTMMDAIEVEDRPRRTGGDSV